MEPFVFLNDRIIPASEACISPFDRGFLYGDGLFETLRAYRGNVHLRGRHLRRLRTGAGHLGIHIPPDPDLSEMLSRVVDANGGGDMVLRLTVTRGVGGLPSDLVSAGHPTIFIAPRPVSGPTASQESLITLSVIRTPSGYGPTIKSLNYLPAILASRELSAAGVREGIMFTADGWVAEGTTSNIFCVIGGTLVTPPCTLGILDGVTRSRAIELAADLGADVREERFTRDALLRSDECFITSTTREIMSVDSVDSTTIGNGNVGPITAALQRRYRDETPSDV